MADRVGHGLLHDVEHEQPVGDRHAGALGVTQVLGDDRVERHRGPHGRREPAERELQRLAHADVHAHGHERVTQGPHVALAHLVELVGEVVQRAGVGAALRGEALEAVREEDQALLHAAVQAARDVAAHLEVDLLGRASGTLGLLLLGPTPFLGHAQPRTDVVVVQGEGHGEDDREESEGQLDGEEPAVGRRVAQGREQLDAHEGGQPGDAADPRQAPPPPVPPHLGEPRQPGDGEAGRDEVRREHRDHAPPVRGGDGDADLVLGAPGRPLACRRERGGQHVDQAQDEGSARRLALLGRHGQYLLDCWTNASTAMTRGLAFSEGISSAL